MVAFDLLDLIGNLYAAATDPSMWDASVSQLVEALGYAAAYLFLTNRAVNSTSAQIIVNMPEEMIPEYETDYLKICPPCRVYRENPGAKVRYDDMHISEEQMRRDPFQAWLYRSSGLKYYIGAVFDVEDHTSLVLTLNRTPEQGHVQQKDIQTFSKVLPHLERAIQIRARLGYLDVRTQAMEAALNQLTCAVIILNTTGVVALANEAAEHVLKEDDGLFLGDDALLAKHGQDNQLLQGKIQEVLTTSIQQGTAAGGTVTIHRPSGKRSYSLLIAPIPRREVLLVVNQPAALIFIIDPEDMKGPPAEHLQAHFELTPMEADIAIRLCAGTRLEDVASAKGISMETVRTHLKHIFSKTGVRRQADLLRLLAHIAGVRT